MAIEFNKYSMMMLPPEYVLGKLSLITWADVWWVYNRGSMGWRLPVAIAEARLTDPPFDPLELELADVGKGEDYRVGETVEELALRSTVPEDAIARKWMYLTLLWLVRDTMGLKALSEQLDSAYCDFDHLSEFSSFVSYMPSEDGLVSGAHPAEKFKNRFPGMWSEYLKEIGESQA